MSTTLVVAKPKKSSGVAAPQECWHLCPARTSAACQERHGEWQHPVNHIAKIDEWERVCPDCETPEIPING